MSVDIKKVIAWMDEALHYVGCPTWSPSLEEEGRRLLSQIMQERHASDRPSDASCKAVFPGRRHVEEAIQSAENPTGMQLNDGKERVTLPGGTLRLMLRLIDDAARKKASAVVGSDAQDANRYRFIRSMLNMSSEQNEVVAQAMAGVFAPDAEGIPTEAEFDASVDAGISSVAAERKP